jgi:hypothetical protein
VASLEGAAEPSGADLGATEILECGDRLPLLLARVAQALEPCAVLFMRAVGEVEPGDVHPGVDE